MKFRLGEIGLGFVTAFTVGLCGISFFDHGPVFAEDEGTSPRQLEAENTKGLDFPVPWGFRHGRPARVYFSFEVGQDGKPTNIETLKTIPHDDYEGVAKTTLKKFVFPAKDIGKRGFEEFQYCVMGDGQSTFACKIRFDRLNGDVSEKAKAPGDRGFYEIDRYGGFPRVSKYVLPAYPRPAILRELCGWVKVAFDVSEKGKPKNISILENSRTKQFDLSVRDAIKKFRFAEGDEVTRITYKVSFEIPGKCKVDSH